VPVVVPVIVAVVVAGCSGSHKTTPPPSHTATVSTPATASPADVAAITALYQRFVDPRIPVTQKTALIQDGPAFLPAMQAESKNPQASSISLQVTGVQLAKPDLATVVFTILVKGSPLLPDQKGYAIRDNGVWKIAGTTFCGLLAAQGPSSIPPVCSQPAATALPTG
jgi:hypothetical protein